jgi:hypothetical protein
MSLPLEAYALIGDCETAPASPPSSARQTMGGGCSPPLTPTSTSPVATGVRDAFRQENALNWLLGAIPLAFALRFVPSWHNDTALFAAPARRQHGVHSPSSPMSRGTPASPVASYIL